MGFFLGPEQQAKRRLNHLGHGAPLARRFALELTHDGIINVKGGFHMESHIINMAIWQRATRAVRVTVRRHGVNVKWRKRGGGAVSGGLANA